MIQIYLKLFDQLQNLADICINVFIRCYCHRNMNFNHLTLM